MKKEKISKVVLLSALILALTLFSQLANSAEKGYPSREIELVVPFAAGGMVDVASRAISDELSKALGAPIVIVNKGGAGGTIGAQYVTQAKPDGYTIMGGPHSLFVLVPSMMKNLPYKATDFTPIARIVTSPFVFCFRKDSPFKTFAEVIAYAKKNPGKLSCGTSGVATGSHFMLEMLKLAAGIEIQHVPFKGGSEVIAATIGGHVDINSTTVNPIYPMVKSGDLRILATADRLTEFPKVPTMAELGYPDAALGSWVGYVGPKGLDKAVVDKLASALEKAIKVPKIVKNLVDTGNQVQYVAKEAFGQDIEKDLKKMAAIVKKANIAVK